MNIDAWIENYDRQRAAAEHTPAILLHELPQLEIPEVLDPSATQTDDDHCPSEYWDAVQQWLPEHLRHIAYTDRKLTVDIEAGTTSLAEAMDILRSRIDQTFEWQNKILNAEWSVRRAAAQATLLLLDQCADDANSEVLHTKMFTLLLGERYRCHAGTLFSYNQGAWHPTSSGTLRAEDLEFLTRAARRAQAYFAHPLDRNAVQRDFDAVAWELKVIFSLDDDQPLLEWQLGEISTTKPEKRSKQWCLGCAELMRDLRKALQDNSKSLVKSFVRWSDSTLSDKAIAGIAFADCYINTTKGKVRQLKKDPRQNCYVSVPSSLAWTPPDSARRRLASLLVSSFAKTEGLQILLAQAALALSRHRQPELMHVLVGSGADGKSMICIDLLRACFGTAYGNPPCSILQVEREFQQQGHAFFHCAMLAIDEARRDGAVVEDTLKNYISGGLLPLRRNHEMDTKYCSFEFAAKLWLMNGLDIPSLPTSLEASLSRRFLCTFMRNTLTFDKTAANVSQCVFPCDPEAKTFCSSPAAVWSFYNDWLLPFMDKHDPTACQKLLTEISPESQVAKDTQWLLQRMARQTTAETPDGDEPSETVPAQMSDLGQAEAIVRETHAALTTPFVAQHQINRLLTKTNPGVSSRPKSGIKRTRSEHLQDACKQWPHLVRELKVQAGKPAKFQRRMLDLGHMQSVLQGLCSTQDEILRVFGAWDDWQWEEEPSGEATWDDACEGGAPEGFPWADDLWDCNCCLDMAKSEEYVQDGRDARQDQLEQFLEVARSHGQAADAGLTVLKHVGRKKLVGDTPLGRHFFPHISLPALTRKARQAICPNHSVEFDQMNAVPNIMVLLAGKANILTPCLQRYCAHRNAWREAVAQYYNTDEEAAKTLLLKATFGFALPLKEHPAAGVLPLLEGIAVESRTLREFLCAANAPVMAQMVAAKRPRPATSTLAFMVFEEEDRATQTLVNLLEEYGWRLVCPVFDAVVAVPGPDAVPGTDQAVAQAFHAATGLQLQLKNIS